MSRNPVTIFSIVKFIPASCFLIGLLLILFSRNVKFRWEKNYCKNMFSPFPVFLFYFISLFWICYIHSIVLFWQQRESNTADFIRNSKHVVASRLYLSAEYDFYFDLTDLSLEVITTSSQSEVLRCKIHTCLWLTKLTWKKKIQHIWQRFKIVSTAGVLI